MPPLRQLVSLSQDETRKGGKKGEGGHTYYIGPPEVSSIRESELSTVLYDVGLGWSPFRSPI